MSDTNFFQILESGSLVDLHTKFGGSNSKRRKKCHWDRTSVTDGFGQTVRPVCDAHACMSCMHACPNYGACDVALTLCGPMTAAECWMLPHDAYPAATMLETHRTLLN